MPCLLAIDAFSKINVVEDELFGFAMSRPSGEIAITDLAISKILRMPVERYRTLFPHVTAAIQLRQKQRPIKPGDLVHYVYVDNQQMNPLKRIAPLDSPKAMMPTSMPKCFST